MTGETVAIIPARGGSKGVPRKNILRVGGIPLVARAVRTARAADIDRVIVSTDDDEIAGVAESWGAEVVRRPADLADDAATSEDAVLHALEDLASRGVVVDTVAFLQATSPFIPVEPLSDAVARVRSGDADSVFSARESYEFSWAEDDGEAWAVGHDRDHRPRRRGPRSALRRNGRVLRVPRRESARRGTGSSAAPRSRGYRRNSRSRSTPPTSWRPPVFSRRSPMPDSATAST